MQITKFWISTCFSETPNISNNLPQIISKPKDRSNIEYHNQL